MKKQDLLKLHEASIESLEKDLQVKLQELANLRLQKKAGKLESPSKLKVLTDDIARIRTILTEKMLTK